MADTELLVIKIPKEIMEYIKNNGCLSVIYNDEVAKAIINGISFNKIRAEIELQREEASNKHSEDTELQAFYDGLNDGLKDARDILDEYEADILDEYEAENEIHCNCTDEEIAKSFVEDVEAVKDLLPRAESGARNETT